jgi:hypothetical protein
MSGGVVLVRNRTPVFLPGKLFQSGQDNHLDSEFFATSRNNIDFLSHVVYFVAHRIISYGTRAFHCELSQPAGIAGSHPS